MMIPFGFWGNAKLVKDGLVVWLDAANTDSYSGSGIVWSDLTTSGNDASIDSGSPVFNSGNGGHFVFDGVDDSFQLTQTSTTMALDYISIGAWVKANSGAFGYIISAQNADGSIPWHLNVKGNNSATLLDGMAAFGIEGISSWRNSDAVTDIRGDGNWHYVTGTYDGTNFKYYIDGVLDSSDSFTTAVLRKNTVNPRIGVYQGDNQYYSGAIAEMHIYNRALTANEVSRNFVATKSRFT